VGDEEARRGGRHARKVNETAIRHLHPTFDTYSGAG
jgi:hypothetical protein